MMKTETAMEIADQICNLFDVDQDDSETFFEVYDIIRDELFRQEKILIDAARVIKGETAMKKIDDWCPLSNASQPANTADGDKPQAPLDCKGIIHKEGESMVGKADSRR